MLKQATALAVIMTLAACSGTGTPAEETTAAAPDASATTNGQASSVTSVLPVIISMVRAMSALLLVLGALFFTTVLGMGFVHIFSVNR